MVSFSIKEQSFVFRHISEDVHKQTDMNLQIASQSVSAMREAKMSKKRRAPEFASNRFVRVSTGVILAPCLSFEWNCRISKISQTMFIFKLRWSYMFLQ
jgi:hypothetical protein